MQRYVATIAITQSVVRPYGGCMRVAQEFLGSLDLKPLTNLDPSKYAEWLDEQTKVLMAKFAIENLWSRARKAINIFMTMASLNRFLCEAYALEHLEDVLEVPLDNIVGKRLFDLAKGKLPTWENLTALDSKKSEKYQQFAKTWAKEREIPRARLDVELWGA
jgi:hypothetical protein